MILRPLEKSFLRWCHYNPMLTEAEQFYLNIFTAEVVGEPHDAHPSLLDLAESALAVFLRVCDSQGF